ENRITGPFAKEEVAARVANGELRELDEVCEAGGYWIYLHERAESLKILGVELPRTKRKEDIHEEETETETETVTATAPLSIQGASGMGTTVMRTTRTVSQSEPLVANRAPETTSLMKYLLITIAV